MNLKYRDFFIINDDDSRVIKQELYLSENRQRALNPEQEKEVVKLYTDAENPISTLSIAKLFNIGGATVVNILKRNGVKLRDSVTASKMSDKFKQSHILKRKLTPEQEKEVVKLYIDVENPLSSKQIAKLFNVTDMTILKILVRNGVKIRDKSVSIRLSTAFKDSRIKRRKLTPEQEKEVVKLYTDEENPINASQIANVFKSVPSVILKVLRRNGVKIRDRSLTGILSTTRKNQDYSRTHHSTRNITGKGISGTQYFDVGASDNVAPSRVIPKRLGGHSPEL